MGRGTWKVERLSPSREERFQWGEEILPHTLTPQHLDRPWSTPVPPLAEVKSGRRW